LIIKKYHIYEIFFYEILKKSKIIENMKNIYNIPKVKNKPFICGVKYLDCTF